MKGRKTSEDKIAVILMLHKRGFTDRQISAQTGASESSIRNYIAAASNNCAGRSKLLRDLNVRIELTQKTLNTKAEFYHFVTLHGSEKQRQNALYDITTLRSELNELLKQRDELLTGGDNHAKDQR